MTARDQADGGVPIDAIRQLVNAAGLAAQFDDIREIRIDPYEVVVTWHHRRDGKLHLADGTVERRTARLAIDRSGGSDPPSVAADGRTGPGERDRTQGPAQGESEGRDG